MESVIRRGVRFGYCTTNQAPVAEFVTEADETLFKSILHIKHVLHQLLPDKTQSTYNLRSKNMTSLLTNATGPTPSPHMLHGLASLHVQLLSGIHSAQAWLFISLLLYTWQTRLGSADRPRPQKNSGSESVSDRNHSLLITGSSRRRSRG